MPLDAESRDLLAWLNAGGAGGIDPQDIAAARRGYELLFRELGGAPAPGIDMFDLTVSGPAGPIPIRVYQPSGNRTRPAVLFLHGGGWTMGGLDSYDGPVSRMAAVSGCCFVAVGYRLAPEHKFPAALEDAGFILSWMAGPGARLIDTDPAQIAVCGDSAGGTLAAVLAAEHPHRLKAQALLYAVLTLADDSGLESRQKLGNGEYFLSRDGIAWAAGNYLSDPSEVSDPRVSPLLRMDLSGLPPALVVTAGHDPLKDEGKAYALRLGAAGVPAEHLSFPDTFHGFLSFAARLAIGREGLDRVAQWLGGRLGGKTLSPPISV